LARGFNAVVSVFQESEVQLEPAGVGVSLALGQALDPINDLVERFSWVMLASLTSLGIQKFLIEITPFLSIQILLLLALCALLAGLRKSLLAIISPQQPAVQYQNWVLLDNKKRVYLCTYER